MLYSEMRATAKTGDVILVEGRSFVSRLIRGATGQSISHVGMLMWLGDGNLFMPEQREFKAFRLSRASDRLQQDMRDCRVYYGAAPLQVREWIDAHDDELVEAVFATRNGRYGYLELGSVLWSQWTQRDSRSKRLVCSTWVQRLWELSDWRYPQAPDPGDYLDACSSVHSLDLREFYR